MSHTGSARHRQVSFFSEQHPLIKQIGGSTGRAGVSGGSWVGAEGKGGWAVGTLRVRSMENWKETMGGRSILII